MTSSCVFHPTIYFYALELVRHGFNSRYSTYKNMSSHIIVGHCYWLLYPRPTKLEGGYTGFTLFVRPSVCPSIRPSVCRRHGFRSISQVCFGISISNFLCMLMVAIGRSLLIFSDVTFKMAAWRPYWIFWFPDSNLTLALNINFKLQGHNIYVYGQKPIDFQRRHFQNGCLAAILDFLVSRL